MKKGQLKDPLFLITFSLIWIIAGLDALAITLHLFWSIWWFDILLHFLGGFWVVIAINWLYYNSGYIKNVIISKRRVLLVSLGGLLVIAVLWELYELLVITFYIEDYIIDTVIDFIMDGLGGAAALWYVLRFRYHELGKIYEHADSK